MTFQEFDPVSRFVAGTVGPTGRTFYLQASDGRRVVTVAVEKQQVSILADRINDVLDQLAPTTAIEPGQPGGAPRTPIRSRLRSRRTGASRPCPSPGTRGRQRLVIECHDHDPDELEGDEAAADPVAGGAEAAEESPFSELAQGDA